MNIDERLDRLTERHEALAQTIELLTADVREVVAAQKENGKQIGELATFIRQLSEIALRHDNRLDRHDDRLDKLDRDQH